MINIGGPLTFNASWAAYKAGFGSVGSSAYWIGNDILHNMTKDGSYMLRVDMQAINGLWFWASYATLGT